jgi:SMC interacting uncharacterized protein involved in chromosome segregation
MSRKTRKLEGRLGKVEKQLAQLTKSSEKLAKKHKHSIPALSDLQVHLEHVEEKVKALRKH